MMALLDFLPFGKKEAEKPDILPVLPEEIYRAGVLDLQDVIAPHALKISSHELDLGEKIARTFFVISYPRFLTTGWFAPIINMDKVLDISIFVHPMDTNAMLRKFQKKVAEIQSQISTREEKGMVRDPMLDTAYSDIEQLRDSLQQAQERIFDVGLYITIYGSTREEIDKIESEVRSILESRLVYIRPALFQQEQGFRSVLPIATDELDVHTKLNSAPLSSIFPFISFDLTSDRGILYGINRHNSSLILFDRFSLENYNSVTFAKSGAGKSYCTKLEILRSLMFDTEVIVIDPEREYEYLAETVGGRYFNISLSSEHHINPFDLAIPHEDENPSDVLRNNIITLVGLFRIMLGGLTPEEDAIIDKAITETYALKDITADSNFAAVEPPLLSDFELVLSGMEGSESLVNRLSKYTKGTWAGFMNRPTNVDMNKKLVVFSVRDMEDDLKPVAMYIITHHIWNAVRKELRKRLLVIDEAWWMMRSEDTASFLFGIAKRGRKYYLGISTITQDVSDFLNSPYGVPMITNSSIQLLLRQSPTSVDLVQQTFKLSDEEKYLLLESDVGEGIFFAGLKHVAIKIIASYTEDQIITSDPSQILAIKKARTELDAVEAEAPIVEPAAPERDSAAPHAIPAELVPLNASQADASGEHSAEQSVLAAPTPAIPAPATPVAPAAPVPTSVPPTVPAPPEPVTSPAEPVLPTPKPEQPQTSPVPKPAAPIDAPASVPVPDASPAPTPVPPIIAKPEPIAPVPTPATPAPAPAPTSNNPVSASEPADKPSVIPPTPIPATAPTPTPTEIPTPAAPAVTPPPPPPAPPAASGNPAITIKPPAPGAERAYEISNALAQLDDTSA